jgi:hypothetical protein
MELLVVELERMRLTLAAEPPSPRPSPAPREVPTDRGASPAAPPPPSRAPNEPPGETRLDVRGDFSRILELQEQLSHMVGVANVRVTHLSGEGATLIVDLAPPAPQ